MLLITVAVYYLSNPTTLMSIAERAEYFGSWTWTHQKWDVREVRGNIAVNIYHFHNTSDLFHFLPYLWTARSAQILGSIFQARKCIFTPKIIVMSCSIKYMWLHIMGVVKMPEVKFQYCVIILPQTDWGYRT
jgi:hypothetical protein